MIKSAHRFPCWRRRNPLAFRSSRQVSLTAKPDTKTPEAALDGLTWALASGVRYRLVRRLSEEIVRLAVEPPVDELIRMAQPYVGPRTNFLILQVVAKAVDFLRRGAADVISAAGINCMVGTAASSFLPAMRADFHQAPAIVLFCGGREGPAQRIRLETFVHQVRQRWQRPAA